MTMTLADELRAISKPVRELKTNKIIDLLMERLQLRAGAGYTTLDVQVDDCANVEAVRQWFRDNGITQSLNTDQKTGLDVIHAYW